MEKFVEGASNVVSAILLFALSSFLVMMSFRFMNIWVSGAIPAYGFLGGAALVFAFSTLVTVGKLYGKK